MKKRRVRYCCLLKAAFMTTSKIRLSRQDCITQHYHFRTVGMKLDFQQFRILKDPKSQRGLSGVALKSRMPVPVIKGDLEVKRNERLIICAYIQSKIHQMGFWGFGVLGFWGDWHELPHMHISQS